jgi:hypothetical protein
VRCAHFLRVINPAFDERDLLAALVAFRIRKGIPDGRAADLDAAQKGVPFQPNEKLLRQWLGKVIARQFSALAALFRALIEELKEIDLSRGIDHRVALVIGVFEIIAERISGQAQQKPRATAPPKGNDAMRRWPNARPGQENSCPKGMMQKLPTRNGAHNGGRCFRLAGRELE